MTKQNVCEASTVDLTQKENLDMALVTAPNTYEIICEYENAANPTITWRNTYAYQKMSTPDPSDDIFTNLFPFASAMAQPDCNLVQFRVYKWVRGGPNPYPNGLPLFVIEHNSACNAPTLWGSAAAGDPLPGSCVLRMDRIHGGQGKPGHLFYRGLLHEGDVASVSGGPIVLTNTATYSQTHLDGIVATTHMDNHLAGGLSASQLCIVQYSDKHNTLGSINNQINFTLIGATQNKKTRKR